MPGAIVTVFHVLDDLISPQHEGGITITLTISTFRITRGEGTMDSCVHGLRTRMGRESLHGGEVPIIRATCVSAFHGPRCGLCAV